MLVLRLEPTHPLIALNMTDLHIGVDPKVTEDLLHHLVIAVMIGIEIGSLILPLTIMNDVITVPHQR